MPSQPPNSPDNADIRPFSATFPAITGRPEHSLPAASPAVPPLRGVDVVCLSHLRWDSVFQRPHHLLTRCARDSRVFFVEEPVEGIEDGAEVRTVAPGVRVGVPRIGRAGQGSPEHRLAATVERVLGSHCVRDYILWYYTPMAIGFTRQLSPLACVYDCMDELSAFAGAPPGLRTAEEELFRKADLILTGGQSLYEAKRNRHPNVHAFPSSVEVPHFNRARRPQADPSDQAAIPRPRLGFFGVIDERMDLDLLAGIAAARPQWHLVMIGPLAKIEAGQLPSAPNIHYLGKKTYDQLPSYLGGWDVALLPFARNESTRFISPTKTPEYLAAGKPVVSTSIRDVVRPYGERGLVRIADTVPAFVAAVEASLAEDDAARVAAADAFLSHMSWDATWARMAALVAVAVEQRRRA
ncbi:MAG: glycosyltransferase family 1 protein [Acidobacteria bacterium]|nr:MAG: glycosyltransferase family 1 protein [Acidobacteriota bacterium]